MCGDLHRFSLAMGFPLLLCKLMSFPVGIQPCPLHGGRGETEGRAGLSRVAGGSSQKQESERAEEACLGQLPDEYISPPTAKAGTGRAVHYAMAIRMVSTTQAPSKLCPWSAPYCGNSGWNLHFKVKGEGRSLPLSRPRSWDMTVPLITSSSILSLWEFVGKGMHVIESLVWDFWGTEFSSGDAVSNETGSMASICTSLWALSISSLWTETHCWTCFLF